MAHHYRFGRFEVRPRERLLYIDGQSVVLGARAFDVLLVLIERRERLVTKSELLDLVWPGLFVEENNLQVQVSALRKLLGPQVLVTIPGRGYRFALTLEDDATPPAAAATPPALPFTVLPAPPRLLLGRDRDLDELGLLLQKHVLVSIVGAAGIGKTALARATAHVRQSAHSDGAIWVELSTVADATQVPAAVAQAMALPASAGDALPALLATLEPLQLLLVLDNAEHLLEAVAQLAWAIGVRAPGVHLLVTSQAALRVEGERVFRLGGLSVPGAGTPADEAAGHGAVMLFADQAQAADRSFAVTPGNVATVISLCRQLDGMALAIKLAAARLPLLGLPGLEARLGDRLKMLSGVSRSAVSRQQTLCAALDWSHGLLAAAEQTVFRRCAVFVGGFTLELASAVCGDENLDEWAVINALEGLVDRSLLDVDGGEATRYRLSECAREYAWLKLDEAGEREQLQQRHAEAGSVLMDKAYEAYWVSADAPWLTLWAPEIDNIRAALDWSSQWQSALAIRLAGAAAPLFLLLGLAAEGRKRCLAIEAHTRTCAPSADMARYWLERSRLHWGISNTRMHDFALLAAAHYRSSNDARGLFLALRCAAGSAAVSTAEASVMLEEIIRLEQADWSPRLRSQRLLAEISVYQAAGHMTEARFALESLHLLAISAGLDAAVSAALSGLATLGLAVGDLDEALYRSQELISSRRHHRDNFVLHALATVAAALLLQGRLRDARKALADFVLASRSRDWEWFGLYADLFTLLAALERRAGAAARLQGYADAVYRPLGARDINAAHARAQAGAIIEVLLEETVMVRLMAEGARMDMEAVCALALTENTVCHA